MSLYARIAAGLLLALAIAACWWKFETMLDAADARGYQRRAAEDKIAAEAQTASNRELQRLAEQRLHVLSTRQSKFLAKTAQEIHHAAAPLASCPVPDAVLVRLNAARSCAVGDSAAACGPGDGVPAAR